VLKTKVLSIHLIKKNPTAKANALRGIAIKAKEDFEKRLEDSNLSAVDRKNLEVGLAEINEAIKKLDDVIDQINKAVESAETEKDKINNNPDLTDAEKAKALADFENRLTKIITGLLTEAMQAMASVANAYSRLAGDAHKTMTSGIGG
jgi:polyphosphate kinase